MDDATPSPPHVHDSALAEDLQCHLHAAHVDPAVVLDAEPGAARTTVIRVTDEGTELGPRLTVTYE